jgi:phosphate transport system permease protein
VILSIGRILAETAPLYLTSGLSSSSSISLINPGQTLTTRIYAQIYTADVNQGSHIMYECAFVTMILVLLIILVVHVIIPAYYNHKKNKAKEQYLRVKRHEQQIATAQVAMRKVLIPNDQLSDDQKHILGVKETDPPDKKRKVRRKEDS